MGAKKVIMIGTIVVAVIFGTFFTKCVKDKGIFMHAKIEDQVTKPSKNEGYNVKVSSPKYSLTSKQLYDLIHTFKENGKSKGKSSELSPNETLSIDSAQYLLEATINFDFDYTSTDATDTRYQETTYYFEYDGDNGVMSTEEATSIYESMYTRFNDVIGGDSLIAAIDVQAYITPSLSTGYFVVTAAVLATGTQYQCNTGGFGANNYYILAPTAVIQAHFAIPASYWPNANATDASYYFPSKVNCSEFFWGACEQGYYFSSISLYLHQPNSPSDIYMPFISLQPQANYASGPAWSSINYFNATDMNGFVSNTKSLIAGSYSAPFTLVENSASVHPTFVGPDGNSPYNLSYFWILKWATGERVCRYPDN
jgi:hypothetical protein